MLHVSRIHSFLFLSSALLYCYTTICIILFNFKTPNPTFQSLRTFLILCLLTVRKSSECPAFFGQVQKNSPESVIQNISHKKKRTRLCRSVLFLFLNFILGGLLIKY